MNSPENLNPPVFISASQSSHISIGQPSSCHREEGQTELSTALPPILIAWNNDGAVADAGGEAHPVRERGFLIPSTQHDRGFWLLQGAFTRQQGWSSLEVRSMAVPVSFQPRYVLIKRIGDVAVSLILLGLLSPLFLLISILIRLESPGPVFFCQRRIGKDGVDFLLWKFRSMDVNAPKYAPSPTSNLDRRLTGIGRLIRRVSLDELPQLWNVLRGEMSLVGPRPEMPFLVDSYTPFERLRLAVKPGITGLWQISPARAFPIHENLQYDLHYIQHQNLFLDLSILLRTAAAVIRGVGAV